MLIETRMAYALILRYLLLNHSQKNVKTEKLVLIDFGPHHVC